MAARKTQTAFLIVLLLILHFNADAQNEKAAGYMGLWSKFGLRHEYGYRLSGGMATFSSQHNPMAIHVPEQKKTFFVYCGTAGPDTSHVQIMVSYFDHVTNKVPKPVIVLDKMGVTDPQDNATLSIDTAGHISVFISGRGRTRPGYIFRSQKPWSIDSFDMVFTGEILFPQVWWMNDTSFLMMHTRVQKGSELYWSSSKDGTTWKQSSKLAGMGGHFQVTNVFGNRLYSVFNVCPNGNPDTRTNLYLVYTDDMGSTWKNVEDEIIAPPITEIANEALIHDYRAGKKLVYIQDLNFDENGNPVILYLLSDDHLPGPASREWMIASWRNGEWNFSKVCDMSHNYSLGSIYIYRDEWRLIGPSDPGPSKYGMGGEMVLWTSADRGKTWVKSGKITSGSMFNQSHARRPFNPHDEFYAFWTDGDSEKRSVSRLIFTNRKCDKVWMLPYEMKKDFEKAVRLRK